MKITGAILAGAIAVLAAGSAAASVITVPFDFIGTSAPYDIVGQFTMTTGPGGVDTVTGVSGTFFTPLGNEPLDQILPNDTFGGGFPDNLFYTQNDAFGPGTGYVDGLGVGFTSDAAGGLPALDFDIFIEGGGAVLTIVEGGGVLPVEGTLSAPEPATWAILLAGFAGLGVALRARRGKLAAA